MRLTFVSIWTTLLASVSTAAFGQDEPALEMPPAAIAVPSGAPHAPAAAVEPARRPRRHGWTLEAGLGVGYIGVPDADYGRGGLYGLNLGAGRFLTPDLAFTLRGTGVYTLGAEGAMTMASALLSVQSFVTERIAVAGGVGLMFADIAFGSTRVSHDPGFAGNVRFGFSLGDWASGTLRVVFEMNAGKVGATRLISDGLGLEWQFY